MSEMIERVAKAIFQSRYSRPEHLEYWPDRLDELVNGPPFDADGYRDMARNAIEAMREPTDTMVSAADTDCWPQLRDNWREMIDAALGKVDA